MTIEFKPSMKKDELLEIAVLNGIAADDSMTRAQIMDALKAAGAEGKPDGFCAHAVKTGQVRCRQCGGYAGNAGQGYYYTLPPGLFSRQKPENEKQKCRSLQTHGSHMRKQNQRIYHICVPQ